MKKASNDLTGDGAEISIKPPNPFVPTTEFKKTVNTIKDKTAGFRSDFNMFLSGQEYALQACESSVNELLKIHGKL